jgi:hypothetical protein
MTTSNYITFILLGVIGLVFLIDFILNSKKKPLEKSVEKFVEKEKDKKKNWLNLKSFFWAYPIIFLLSQIIFFGLLIDFDNLDYYLELENYFDDYTINGTQFMDYYDYTPDYAPCGPFWFSLFFTVPLMIFHLLWFLKNNFGNWILKRKKNISMSLLIISFVKLLLNYFIYTSQVRKYPYGNTYERKDADFSFHLSNLYSLEIDLFIPIIIVFLIVVWFFNDKIKAK